MKERGKQSGDPSGWTSLLAALRETDTISSADVARLVRQHTSVTPGHALRRLKRDRVLQHPKAPRRGLYVVTDQKGSGFISDPVEAVKAVCGPETVFAYGTALFLHGLSRYGRLSECYVLTATRKNRKRVGSVIVRYVQTPLENDMGVISHPYAAAIVHVTDMERTLVDCIHRVKYAQGWENVAQAIERAE